MVGFAIQTTTRNLHPNAYSYHSDRSAITKKDWSIEFSSNFLEEREKSLKKEQERFMNDVITNW